MGTDLYYRVLDRTYTEPSNNEPGVLIGNFKTKSWYYLGIEHENSKGIGRPLLKVVINDELKTPKEIPFPHIENNASINKFSIGEGLIGRVSSVIAFKVPLGHKK